MYEPHSVYLWVSVEKAVGGSRPFESHLLRAFSYFPGPAAPPGFSLVAEGGPPLWPWRRGLLIVATSPVGSTGSRAFRPQ